MKIKYKKMFSFVPKQVPHEMEIIPKRGQKNKEIALDCLNTSLEKIVDSVTNIKAIIKMQDLTPVEMRKNLRNLLKDINQVNTLLTKCKNIQYKTKRTRESHNTGLEKLRPISENMALFADWEYGVTQKSRYDVTNLLCAYIKDNELRNPDNKTIIIPDAKLKKLLQLEDDIVLKYPTMQKYLKHCFEEVKPDDDTEKSVAAAALKKHVSKTKETPAPVKKEAKSVKKDKDKDKEPVTATAAKSKKDKKK